LSQQGAPAIGQPALRLLALTCGQIGRIYPRAPPDQPSDWFAYDGDDMALGWLARSGSMSYPKTYESSKTS
jgi:hypothetical protein